jgi:hypothetical protein
LYTVLYMGQINNWYLARRVMPALHDWAVPSHALVQESAAREGSD